MLINNGYNVYIFKNVVHNKTNILVVSNFMYHQVQYNRLLIMNIQK
jgi:hypothetical protein